MIKIFKNITVCKTQMNLYWYLNFIQTRKKNIVEYLQKGFFQAFLDFDDSHYYSILKSFYVLEQEDKESFDLIGQL